MKTTSSDLFNLIHSLTANERAYFKRFAGVYRKPSENNYLKLFEAIYAQKEYDEEALKEQFKNDKLGSYFPRAKKYLYDKILESMRLLNKKNSIGTRLRNQIFNATFLLNRSLIKQSMKKIRQIKKEAIGANRWADYIAVLKVEARLHIENNDKKTSYTDLLKLREDAGLSVQKYRKELNEYINMRQMEFLLVRNTTYNQAKIEGLYQNMLNNPPFQCATAQINYFHTLGTYSMHYLNDALQTKQYYKRAVQLLEENTLVLKKKPEHYLLLLGRLIEITIIQLSFEESQKYLQALKEKLFGKEDLFGNDKNVKLLAELEYYYNSLFCLSFFGKHDEALKLLEASLIELEGKLSKTYGYKQLQIRYTFMEIYFFQEQFENALHQANLVLALPFFDNHPVKEVVTTWRLFIHWELKHYDLLEHLIRNALRYKKRHGGTNTSHRILVEMLQRLLTCRCEKVVWQEIYDAFPVRNPLEDADNLIIQGYALSRLKGKPIKEAHRELVDGYKNRLCKKREQLESSKNPE